MSSWTYGLIVSISFLGLLMTFLFFKPEITRFRNSFISVNSSLVYESTAAREKSGSTALFAPATSSPIETSSPPENVKKQSILTPEVQSEVKPMVTENTVISSPNQVINRYPFPVKSVEELDTIAREALVNILCKSDTAGVKSTSGSGVIIDPRGIVLTNAHIAQYLLLASRADVEVGCVIRAGSPAVAKWKPQLLYIPPAWVHKNASKIVESSPLGTGEDDYALLYLSQSIDGSPLPPIFPFVPFDIREAVSVTGDSALIAAYPLEFAANSGAENLYLSTAITTIKQMLTFTENSLDALSLGSNPLAQGGSSGGAVLNAWGQLVGLVVTTTEGTTTGTRDLRAITLSHIERSIRTHAGEKLAELLARDPSVQASRFAREEAPPLSQLLRDQIAKRQ